MFPGLTCSISWCSKELTKLVLKRICSYLRCFDATKTVLHVVVSPPYSQVMSFKTKFSNIFPTISWKLRPPNLIEHNLFKTYTSNYTNDSIDGQTCNVLYSFCFLFCGWQKIFTDKDSRFIISINLSHLLISLFIWYFELNKVFF